jgi:hypothetical protein
MNIIRSCTVDEDYEIEINRRGHKIKEYKKELARNELTILKHKENYEKSLKLNAKYQMETQLIRDEKEHNERIFDKELQKKTIELKKTLHILKELDGEVHKSIEDTIKLKSELNHCLQIQNANSYPPEKSISRYYLIIYIYNFLIQ